MSTGGLAELVGRIACDLPAHDCGVLAAGAEEGHGALKSLVTHAAGPAVRSAAAQLHSAWKADQRPAAEIAGMLRGAVAGAARQRAAERVDVVWTGPSSAVHTSRSTEAVVKELVESAKRSLLIVSYNVWPYPLLTAALQSAAAQGVEIIVLLERHADNTKFHGADKDSFPTVPSLRWHWPASQRTGGAALHAKVVVVDDHVAFVTSANLTGMAATHNLECGLLVRGGPTPREIREHVLDLYHRGVFAPVPSTFGSST